MLDNLSGFMMPSMPYGGPGGGPGGTGNVLPPAPPPPSMPPGPPAMPPMPEPPPGPPPLSSPMGGPAPPPQMPSVGDLDPADLQYVTETQTDGTLLVRVRLPDGTVGPVVAHMPPPKLKGNSGPTKK